MNPFEPNADEAEHPLQEQSSTTFGRLPDDPPAPLPDTSDQIPTLRGRKPRLRQGDTSPDTGALVPNLVASGHDREDIPNPSLSLTRAAQGLIHFEHDDATPALRPRRSIPVRARRSRTGAIVAAALLLLVAVLLASLVGGIKILSAARSQTATKTALANAEGTAAIHTATTKFLATAYAGATATQAVLMRPYSAPELSCQKDSLWMIIKSDPISQIICHPGFLEYRIPGSSNTSDDLYLAWYPNAPVPLKRIITFQAISMNNIVIDMSEEANDNRVRLSIINDGAYIIQSGDTSQQGQIDPSSNYTFKDICDGSTDQLFINTARVFQTTVQATSNRFEQGGGFDIRLYSDRSGSPASVILKNFTLTPLS